MTRFRFFLATAALLCSLPSFSYAKEIVDANNPLASVKSISLHNIYTPYYYSARGTMSNTAWIRYAQPLGRVLIRASLPVNTLQVNSTTGSGLGDLNVFATYIVTKPTSRSQFGIGPILTFPTATQAMLGSGKWQAGAAAVAYFTISTAFQLGILATWQHSFAGREERTKVHVGSLQPMCMWQLGKGLYMRSTGIIVLDFANENYSIPLGLGIGKVFSGKKATFNLFAEPQFTVWHMGRSIPKVQFFIGVNTQF